MKAGATPEEITDKKRLLREWLSESRIERLQSFGKFIVFMEANTTARKSVLSLVVDGKELAERIASDDARVAVRPYLQLVTDSARDERCTNHKLMDIWRYFRLTWSTPSESTPGRTIKYLIRDAAHPNHAVMGIFSLENCAVQITDRDEFIGWNAEGYIRRMLERELEQARECFLILLLTHQINSAIFCQTCHNGDMENELRTNAVRLSPEQQYE
ncbi:MAG: DUF4338 domain-containing protein, partial [Candidatus Accumulibacter sp.]|nr:DUF4338 domain-containing protein [Accumulibacter sp.]